jgi:hypothetical protein
MTKARSSADFAAGGFFAGKNKIINGDFSVWQRGTSVALGGYGADRFRATGIGNFSRQTFTPGTAPVAGYEGQYFGRWNLTSNSQNYDFGQRIEDARTFAGQTVTLSFWAKASATTSNAFFPRIFQNFGTGGSPSSAVYTDSSNINLTTSWTRYTITLVIPSVSGKTFGTNNDSYLGVIVQCNTTSVVDIDFWGWQLETGPVATPFQTATGTIQGELAACQRYYWRLTPAQNESVYGISIATSTSGASASVNNPVPMRVIPTSVDFSALALLLPAVAFYAASGLTIATNGSSQNVVTITLSASGLTNGRWYFLTNNGGSTGYLGFSAEL